MTLDTHEWLEPDGLGGFASGTVSGVRTRRYHGLLLVAATPPTGRIMLVNGWDGWVESTLGRTSISTQRYAPDVLHPDGVTRLEAFSAEPWPTWTWRLGRDVVLVSELCATRDTPRVVVRWRLDGELPEARLFVRPLLSGRDYHSLHHENASFAFMPEAEGDALVWRPYSGVPGFRSLSNARYEHEPAWYRQFLYTAERERGLDDTEDLASPGVLSWDLGAGDAFWIVESEASARLDRSVPLVSHAEALRSAERTRRAAIPSRLARSAADYLVRRGNGLTIVAGYPWFTDWGRDTFMALRGLCLSTGQLAEARDILLEWAGAVSNGMLPNRFPDAGAEPEFNAVDASLWFVVAVQDLLRLAARRRVVTPADRMRLMEAVGAIVSGYAAGTRFGIRADDDGLLAAGVPGVQLTWMDAKIGSEVITPRVGKPVEVQALWINALAVAGRESASWRSLAARARRSFQARFWNHDRGCLFDVVDVDHVPATADQALRPNQILAVGGLPEAILDGPHAMQVVEVVERELLTPVGLRSLARGEPGYTPRYEGDGATRDRAYHQGTVWPWLLGPFVDAWVRVRGDTPEAWREATTRFIRPLAAAVDQSSFGHLPEIADAEPPFTPRGCPFQAWSLGELLRVSEAARGAGERLA